MKITSFSTVLYSRVAVGLFTLVTIFFLVSHPSTTFRTRFITLDSSTVKVAAFVLFGYISVLATTSSVVKGPFSFPLISIGVLITFKLVILASPAS